MTTRYGPRLQMAMTDTGPASDPGPGANEPVGYQKFAANPFATLTPRTWTKDGDAEIVAQPGGFSTPNVARVTFPAGTFPQGFDPLKLYPENATATPILRAPTGLYIRYKFRLPADYVAIGPPYGNGNTKNWYTSVTNADLAAAFPHGQEAVGGSGFITTGQHAEAGGVGFDTTSPLVIIGALQLMREAFDPYYGGGVGRQIVVSGYDIPDLEVDVSDLTIAKSASGAFRPFLSDGVTSIASAYVASYPYANAGSMVRAVIDHYIDAHTVQLAANAKIAQFDGDTTGLAGPFAAALGAVGFYAPYSGGQAPDYFPNVPPNAMEHDYDPIPDGIKIVRDTTYEIEVHSILNSLGNRNGFVKVWMNGVLSCHWELDIASLLGRFNTTFFSQQVPWGGTLASDYHAYYGEFYCSSGYARSGEEPDHYTLTPASLTPAHGSGLVIAGQFYDANGDPCRAVGIPLTLSTTIAGATLPANPQTRVDGSFSFTVTMPAGIGVSGTVSVTDGGSPARTGVTATITTS